MNCFQREYERYGILWQNENSDRVIRNEQELNEKASYILNNPKKRWSKIAAYPWVGLTARDDLKNGLWIAVRPLL